MKYLCLAYGDKSKMQSLTDAQFQEIVGRCRPHDENLRDSGHVLLQESLEWDSVTIRPGKDGPVVTDGPYVETKEQVGGLFLIEAKDLNEAVRIASMHPAAQLGGEVGWGIEIRPLADGCHR